MAEIIGENQPDINLTKDEITLQVKSDNFVAPISGTSNLKLSAIPDEGYEWRFQNAKFDISFTFRESVFDGSNEIQVGGNVFNCHSNAVYALNRNYYFSKFYVASHNTTLDRVEISARHFGTDYNFSNLFSGITTFGQIQGTNPVENLQVGISVWKRSGNNVTELLAEHSAPVQGGENITSFQIQDDLHPFTSFNAPGIYQATVSEAQNHVLHYKIALYDIYGTPPSPKELSYSDNLYAIRGGSRFENQLFFSNFLMNYIVPEQGGTLFYGFNREGTLIQENYTYWFNSGSGDNYAVKAEVTFKDGSSTIGLVENFAGNGKTVYIIPTGIRNGNIEAISAAAGRSLDEVVKVFFYLQTQFGGIPVASLGQTTVVEREFNEKYFLFETSISGAEVVRFTGQNSQAFEVSKERYREMGIPSRYWERRKIGTRTILAQEQFSCNTGLVSLDNLYRYLDILFSEKVWEINYLDNVRIPIAIEPGSVVIKTDNKSGEYLYQFSFNYAVAYEESSMGLINNFF